MTDAGGSIGSELCRQLVRLGPANLLMLDRDESALHSLQLPIQGHGLLNTDNMILADIRDLEALAAVFARHQPKVVFHAAALKHLPVLEQYPAEAWKTNVVRHSQRADEPRSRGDGELFVNISTNKAANPCIVLGYSKRIAERMTAGAAGRTPGKFVSVRFGNVLGSRGSVLPALTHQIASGGLVTVIYPDVTRFFMMIPAACELVIQTAAAGRDDLEIVFTGLRGGEKMHEELLGEAEVTRTTSHELIDAVQVPPLRIAQVRRSGMRWGEAQGAA